jgi:hypothetical protein
MKVETPSLLPPFTTPARVGREGATIDAWGSLM